jgi:hypothetical protein
MRAGAEHLVALAAGVLDPAEHVGHQAAVTTGSGCSASIAGKCSGEARPRTAVTLATQWIPQEGMRVGGAGGW